VARVTPYVLYSNCEQALDFLARAFGFEERLRYVGEEGYVNHAEMRLGEAVYRNPRALANETVGLYVNVDGDVDELCARAREAGAEITEEPTDQDYGDRRFGAKDPEGHSWWFAQPIGSEAVEPASAAAAS
jgi:uncharacterized glyoxalase superfamily protein PhnB